MSVKNAVEENLKSAVHHVCGNYSRQLSEWLQENKKVEVSPEEICSAWDIPYRPPTTPITAGVPAQTQLPNYYSGAVSPAKKRGGRTKKTANPDGPKCEYKMTRGKNPGKRCENAVLGDETNGADRYCKNCITKTTVQKLLEKPDNKSTVQAPSIPGTSIHVGEDTTSKADKEINVVSIEGKDGWFKEVNHGFIVQQDSDANIIAHEIEDADGNRRPLNDADRKLALDIGFQIVNTEATTLTVKTTIPNIPDVAEVSN